MFHRSARLLGSAAGIALIAAPPALAHGVRSHPQRAQVRSVFENALREPLTHPLEGSGRGRHRAHASSVNLSCSAQGFMWSYYNGLYVTTELGFTGNQQNMLRARASKVGPWEMYQLCLSNETHYWYLWSDAAERWVTVMLNYSGSEHGMLRAQGTGPGAWERFYNPLEGGGATNVFWSVSNGLYVSAEFAYTGNNYGMLRARSSTIGEWEKFYGYNI